MEAFMRKLKSSISAVSAPMRWAIVCHRYYCVFIIKHGRHSAPLFKLRAPFFRTWPQTQHTLTHTHTHRVPHMLFLFRSAAPWGPPLGLFSEIAGTPLHTHSPPTHLPLPDLYKTQVRKSVAFPSNHRHLNATINGGVLQLKESDPPPTPCERWFTFLFNGSQTRRCYCTERLLPTRLTVYLSTPPPPVSPHPSVYAFLPCNLVFFFFVWLLYGRLYMPALPVSRSPTESPVFVPPWIHSSFHLCWKTSRKLRLKEHADRETPK